MGRPRNPNRKRVQVDVALSSEWMTAFNAWATLTKQRVPDLIAHALRWQYGASVEQMMQVKEQAHDDK
jgi:hypothetical protein